MFQRRSFLKAFSVFADETAGFPERSSNMDAPSPSPLLTYTPPISPPIPEREPHAGLRAEVGAQTLRIFRREAPVTVLGPGSRAVIWVQGCPFACRNCIVPESWEAEGGEQISVAELASWVLEQPEIEGLTLSGGEPMAQAAALTQLIRQVVAQRDLSVVCYTGYTHEHLCGHGTPDQQRFLQHIDLLIDGVYLEQRHADLLWRGSANQRLICLSERYRELVATQTAKTDRSAGIEFFMDS
ncbi:MAG: hypothetical protein JWN14_1802, partial [Chthonomonadales bacterium]|nr:hypothetical protein [Chthonomonadales bacterium]